MKTVRTTEELANYPLGSVFTDGQGDVWMIDWHDPASSGPRTRLFSPECTGFFGDEVLRKWGPLTFQWAPNAPESPAPEATGGDARQRMAAALERLGRLVDEERRALDEQRLRNEGFRSYQREIDNSPCPKCEGDRLRPAFDGRPECHAGRWEAQEC